MCTYGIVEGELRMILPWMSSQLTAYVVRQCRLPMSCLWGPHSVRSPVRQCCHVQGRDIIRLILIRLLTPPNFRCGFLCYRFLSDFYSMPSAMPGVNVPAVQTQCRTRFSPLPCVRSSSWWSCAIRVCLHSAHRIRKGATNGLEVVCYR